MKKTTVILAVKYNPMGFDALVAPTEDGVFWLAGHSDGVSRATWRAGQQITVRYAPEDQFAFEDNHGESKEDKGSKEAQS